MESIIRTQCPVCHSPAIAKVLEAEDYTVSHRVFEIWQCAGCTLRFTQAAPDSKSVSAFYQSDNYISHTDTKTGLINRLYHLVRKITLQRKLRLIERFTGITKGTLLDVGAGTGAFAHTASLAGWEVTGLEPDAATRARAANAYGLQLADTAELFNLTPSSFNAITLWHVLEHVHELHSYMQQLKILLEKNGRALIAVPNYTAYDATEYLQYWAAYDVPRHLYHFSPSSMRSLLQQHGLDLLGIQPMWYDSFYISMLSEQNKNGKNNLLKAAFTGMYSNVAAFFNRERCSSVIYIIGKAD